MASIFIVNININIYFIYTTVLNLKIWLTFGLFLIILIKQNFVIGLDKLIYEQIPNFDIIKIKELNIKQKRTGLTI